MKNQKPVELTTTWNRDTNGKVKEAYDGGFHVKAEKKPAKRVANKRSNLQGFTCG